MQVCDESGELDMLAVGIKARTGPAWPDGFRAGSNSDQILGQTFSNSDRVLDFIIESIQFSGRARISL